MNNLIPLPNSAPQTGAAGMSPAAAVAAKGKSEAAAPAFNWPPGDKVGEIKIKFGKIQPHIDKQGWEMSVTWHRKEGHPLNYKHCDIEDWDRGGHGCPSSTSYLFVDDKNGMEPNMWLIEKDKTHAIQFRRQPSGWLGCSILDSDAGGNNKGLLMIHLGDNGQATIGLWDRENEKFYAVDEKSFVQDPNAPLKFRGSKNFPKGAPFPAPFQFHAKNIAGPPGLLPFHYKGQNYVRWQMSDENGAPAWELKDFVIGHGEKSLSLPLRGASEVKSPVDGLFQDWKREGTKWTSFSEETHFAKTFGLIDKSRLKLSLHDNGGVIFAVEEERSNGEKRIYQLDPKWLNDIKGQPEVLSMKTLGRGETFQSFYTDTRATEKDSLNSLRKGIYDLNGGGFQPDLYANMLGRVAI